MKKLNTFLALILAVCFASYSIVPIRAGSPPLHEFPDIQSDAMGAKLQASMIWYANQSNRSGVAVTFRNTFQLSEVPKEGTLSIFADARYILWVNGQYVERGPARFQPNGPEYDVIEISPYLKSGTNVLSLVVVGNLSGGKVMRHVPGLAAILVCDGHEVARTGAGWKCNSSNRYQNIRATWADLLDEQIDASIEDGDWTSPEYDDSRWQPIVSVDGVAWGPLTARRIPRLRENAVPFQIQDGITLPVKLETGQSVLFTTSHLVQAYPVLVFQAEPGSELSISPYKVNYIAKPGPQTYFTLDTIGTTKVDIKVKKGRVTLTDFKLMERLYPYDRLGKFSCDDAFLNNLWQMCARSCEVLSEDSYVDCADRERVEWMDDTPPGYEITRTTMAGPEGKDGKPVYSDPRLMEELIRRTGLTLQPDGWVKAHTCSDRYDIHAKMEDRACDWIEGLRLYYEATGDTKVIKEIWPAVVAQMDYFLARRGDQGLVSARDWVVWGNPLGYLIGQTTTLNVFVQKALSDSAFLAKVIGKKSDSGRFAKESVMLSKRINTVLWDDNSGSYYSGYFSDAEAATNAAAKRPLKMPRINSLTASTLHANVFALDRGVVPVERRDRVIASMLKQIPDHCSGSIMIYYYLIKQMYSLDRSELDARILEMFRQGWGPMVKSDWQCSWEGFEGGSKAHIYGMYPGYFLSAYVLGVRRDAPVSKHQIIVEPHLAGLTHAEGVVVTEFGLVPISWKRTNGHLQFALTVPAGAKALLALPDRPDAGKIGLDGETILGRIQGSRRIITLKPGRHVGEY